MTEKPDPLIGTKLGDYTILALIGRGGMARVYEGLDEKLHRRAAVKVIEVQHDQEDELTERFLREGRAAASLEHPNIVHVYQFGESGDMYYMAMKLIEGKTVLTLLKKLRQKKEYMEPEQIISIVSQIGSALDYAHSKGVIHRDIKPSNIMLTEEGKAILTDFGLTMKIGSDTTLGTAFGTPRYISPEQAIASHKSVPQSDIYSLGVVLYELATNQAPFDSDSPMTLALSHITHRPPMPQSIRADLPHPVQTVILKALEKRPEHRWQTAAEMTQALQEAYRGIEPNVVLSQEVLELPASMAVGATAESRSLPMPKPTKASLLSKVDVDDTAVISTKDLPQPKTDTTQPQVLQPVPVPPRQGNRLLRSFTVLLLLVLAGLGGYALSNANVNMGLPLSLTVPTPTPIPPRIRLIYNSGSLYIYNPTNRTVSLEGIKFVRGDQSGDPFPANWFGDKTHRTLEPNTCFAINLRSTRDQSAPFSCNIPSKVVTHNEPTYFVWVKRNGRDENTTFIVTKDDQPIQTCSMLVNTCEFAIS